MIAIKKFLLLSFLLLCPVVANAQLVVLSNTNESLKMLLASAAQFDGTSTPKDAYLNFSVPGDTDLDADATVALNGTATVTWIYLGDY